MSGGIWLIWNLSIQIVVVKESANMIVVRVPKMGDKEEWLLIAVYGDPHRRDNPIIWSEIESQIQTHQLPVLLTGDFNAIVDPLKKRGGRVALLAANRAFQQWIHGNGLVDLGHHGPAYTWSNKQGGRAAISSRLNRMLASIQWAMQYPESAVFHLPCFNSDHMLVLL